jgi:hypothetical protein
MLSGRDDEAIPRKEIAAPFGLTMTGTLNILNL